MRQRGSIFPSIYTTSVELKAFTEEQILRCETSLSLQSMFTGSVTSVCKGSTLCCLMDNAAQLLLRFSCKGRAWGESNWTSGESGQRRALIRVKRNLYVPQNCRPCRWPRGRIDSNSDLAWRAVTKGEAVETWTLSCLQLCQTNSKPGGYIAAPGYCPSEHGARPSSSVCSSVLAFRTGSVAPLLISSFLNLFLLFSMAPAQKCRVTLQTTCTSHKPVSESGGSIPLGVDSLHKKAKRK